jgi:anti-sigma B factor antagonist
VVTLATEELGEANLQAIAGELIAVADGLARRRLTLDLGAVRYLTSTALGKFVALHKQMRERGGRLLLVNLNDPVYELFQVTQLHRVLDISPISDGPCSPASPLAS